MNNPLNRPLGFGQILDQTFSITKQHFLNFFLIILILSGPFYLLQAVVELLYGAAFFRSVELGTNWLDDLVTSFDATSPSGSVAAELWSGGIELISYLFLPIAQASILLAIFTLRQGEQYSVGSVLKKAFSRFWPIVGCSLLFFLIMLGLFMVPFFLIMILTLAFSFIHPAIGVVIAIFLSIPCFFGVFYFYIRWGFYFGSVVIDRISPGLGRSWNLTKKRTWTLMGIYFLLFIIVLLTMSGVELVFGAFLGNSVLFQLILNVVEMIAWVIYSVAFAVMFFDLKARYDADDLKELIESYDTLKSN
ncbi:hypothetical protein [Alkalihalobacillus sp. LMS39]|uniref:hypothetical protein n=1 Tax=Alkalihalobacillus sp. LMS39 TaxID=2924032 RepID=UPI001FB4BB0A|nr:hypothetical protein [Alkalihalobacillus sp. LMS39]UOE96169.1 hypothetical protein MM271_11455 [Alkalihalobacillus sp. LMS39]